MMNKIHILSGMAGIMLVFFGLIAGPLVLRAWSGDAPPMPTQHAGLGQ